MDVLQQEGLIRLAAFAGVLAVMVVAESLAPRRPAQERRWRHGLRNVGINVLDVAVVRVGMPLLPVGLAVIAGEHGWGVLHLVAWPAWLEILLAVVVFDFVIYVQHIVFHMIPALWRLHMVHHSDLEFDTTTGVRFHPIEILLSLLLKMAVVLVLGPAPVAVLLFEILLNATSLFNHANVHIPAPIDRLLRLVLVTPDMHRVHHSIERRETNSNFGFNLSWWDRLLGTYTPQPRAGHDEMTIGIEPYRKVKQVTFGRLVVMPFQRRRGSYPVGPVESEERTDASD